MDDIDAAFRRAQHLTEVNRWSEAERALGTVLAGDPDHANALGLLTEVLEHLDRPRDAADVARRLIAAHPEDPYGYLALGEAHAFLDEYEEAEPLVRTAIRLDPGDSVAWQQLAEVLAHRLDGANGAVEAAREAVALAPHDADAHAALGTAYLLAEGDGAGAEAAYLDALAIDPADGAHRLLLGLAHLQLGRLDEAADGFVAGLALGPNHKHLKSVATALYLLGVPDRYAELYARVSAALGEPPTVDRTDPEVVEAQLSIAVSWWDTGVREPAVELLELVVEANPEAAEGLATLAEYRFEEGRVDDAGALARRGLAADPANAAALFVLGLVHHARGDTTGAAGWFDRLRALPPDPEDVEWMSLSLAEKDLADRYPLAP